jgi:hypothetical protein
MGVFGSIVDDDDIDVDDVPPIGTLLYIQTSNLLFVDHAKIIPPTPKISRG